MNDERQTKKERREAARAARREAEAAAEKAAAKAKVRNTIWTVLAFVFVGAMIALAVTDSDISLEDMTALGVPTVEVTTPTPDDDASPDPEAAGDELPTATEPGFGDGTLFVSYEQAMDAREAAGCEVLVQNEPYPDREHRTILEAPPASVMYAGLLRPTHSGNHIEAPTQVINRGTADEALDERVLVHNLEHTSTVVYFDRDVATDSEVAEMRRWAEILNLTEFARRGGAGVGVFVTPFDDPGIPDDKGIAFRAWGVAMNCDTWDVDVANHFVLDNHGSHGCAPEQFLPFPEDLMRYVADDNNPTDTNVFSECSAVQEARMSGEALDGDTPSPEESDLSESGEIDLGTIDLDGAEGDQQPDADDDAPADTEAE